MKLNIAYACDDNYIAHTGISILSLLDNNQTVNEITIYLISVNISSTNINAIQSIVDKFKRILIVLPFKELCPNLKLSSVGRHIETVYAKLFFGNIKDVNKIIYFDSDIIINGSLEEMWNIDLGDNYFGLVKTITKDSVLKLGLKKSESFYNDGVAIVNSEKLREDDMQQLFLKFIDFYNGNPPVLSEGTINVVCQGRIKTIHPKFNFGTSFLMHKNRSLNLISNEKEYYPSKIIDEARHNPIVIHYLAGWFMRPWELGSTHPLKNKYFEYKQQTIWKNEPLKFKKLSTKLKFLKFISAILPIEIVKFIIDAFKKTKKWSNNVEVF